MSVNKLKDDEYELFKPISENEKIEIQNDLTKITQKIAERYFKVSHFNGSVAINIRTTSNRYFDILFSWKKSDDEIEVSYERLLEKDLDGYLDSININKKSSGEKLEINDV